MQKKKSKLDWCLSDEERLKIVKPDAEKAKMHITYRYMINDKLEFIRYKDEMAQKHKPDSQS